MYSPKALYVYILLQTTSNWWTMVLLSISRHTATPCNRYNSIVSLFPRLLCAGGARTQWYPINRSSSNPRDNTTIFNCTSYSARNDG